MSCLGEGKVSSRGSGWPGDEMIEVFGTGLGGKKPLTYMAIER